MCSVLKDSPAFSINPSQQYFAPLFLQLILQSQQQPHMEVTQQLLRIEQHTWSRHSVTGTMLAAAGLGWFSRAEQSRSTEWSKQAKSQESQAHVRDHTKAAQKGLVATAGLFSENMKHTLQLCLFTAPRSFYLATRLPFYCLLWLEQKKSVFLFNQSIFIWTNGEVNMLCLW